MRRGYFPYLALSLAVFVVDRATKYLVRTELPRYEVIHILSFLNLVHVENVGSAFGLFKALGNTFFIVIAACIFLFIVFMLVRDRNNRTAFSLILGGAAGNLADRIIFGRVLDFVDVHVGTYHWPSFNVADSALTAGIALMILQSMVRTWRGRRRE